MENEITLNRYIIQTINFWTPCQATFDDPTIPDVESQIRIDMGNQIEDRYVRLLGNLLTYAETSTSDILGFAEIVYYTIERTFNFETKMLEIRIF